MDIPPPLMGEGEGGRGQEKDLLGPPSPSSPPTEGRGDFSVYVFSIMDSLVIVKINAN